VVCVIGVMGSLGTGNTRTIAYAPAPHGGRAGVRGGCIIVKYGISAEQKIQKSKKKGNEFYTSK